ncbi:hypothetical protein Bca4012_063215 [Brassica carinata]
MKSKGVAAVSSSLIKPIGQTGGSSVIGSGIRGKHSVPSGAKGKSIVSDNIEDGLPLDEAGIAAFRRVDLHVQTHDDPVLKLCLWDKAASEFCEKFKASGGTARVILVTTLNPKRFGVLSLSSMTPSRANESVGAEHIVPVPQALVDTIGQTRKFIVKVSTHNLDAKTQTLTVTKVPPLESPEPEAKSGGGVDEEPVNEGEDHAAEPVKRVADGVESADAKRAKCG